ncbi:hypothetical protein [Thalassotalea sp. PS06]|uniref:hypothetical protein n=1 Tax=Thalassotalea sp. PS06 TaxID=2594005 RepID=UPI00163DDED7|nr:hypothetical protein [Thalassotalea sp. PS06]
MKFIDMLRKLTRQKNEISTEPAQQRVNVDINMVESQLTPEDFKPKSDIEQDTAQVD